MHDPNLSKAAMHFPDALIKQILFYVFDGSELVGLRFGELTRPSATDQRLAPHAPQQTMALSRRR
jgi:hypothetical protein